jgi:hypothetical protein
MLIMWMKGHVVEHHRLLSPEEGALCALTLQMLDNDDPESEVIQGHHRNRLVHWG